MKNKCFKRIKDEKQRKQGKGSDKNGKTHDFESDGNSMCSEVLCVSPSPSSVSDHWILDSGCTFHMTPNKHWFSDFKPLEHGKVFMGNNHVCNIKGIGNVFIKMHNGVIRKLTEQNGVAERMNRTIMDKVRCLMVSSSIPKPFWGEAVSTAVYLINRSPSTAINFKTPLELWSGEPPNLSNLREGKLDPRLRKGVFIGYPSGVKGYKVWLKGEPGVRVIVSRDVVFNELDMPCLKAESDSDSSTDVPSDGNVPVEVEDTSEPSQVHGHEPETSGESGIPANHPETDT
ncbi:hypothetical protein M9H77_21404 [Catharanthus roseus]|uniref:Uncharacterized protein n=1 Tax=Catharanthus roseus TaxID=4058 RepID=A0ACC0AMY3_CATRO|nr:hypothetical protein M9H77_21404 [Catharanthus roseus]